MSNLIDELNKYDGVYKRPRIDKKRVKTVTFDNLLKYTNIIEDKWNEEYNDALNEKILDKWREIKDDYADSKKEAEFLRAKADAYEFIEKNYEHNLKDNPDDLRSKAVDIETNGKIQYDYEKAEFFDKIIKVGVDFQDMEGFGISDEVYAELGTEYQEYYENALNKYAEVNVVKFKGVDLSKKAEPKDSKEDKTVAIEEPLKKAMEFENKPKEVRRTYNSVINGVSGDPDYDFDEEDIEYDF